VFETLYDYGLKLSGVPPYWIAETARQQEDAPAAPAQDNFMRNLRKDISKHMDKHALDIFPATTIYAKSLVAERDMVSMKHRDLAWSGSITDAQKRTLIRVITGQVLNFKLISRYTKGRIPPICPLCHAPDSTSHIVCGGCSEPSMKSGVIKRHDKAVHIALNAIRKGPMGANAMIADVTPRTGDGDDLVDDVLPKRLPTHLLNKLRHRTRRALRVVHNLDVHTQTTDCRICALLFDKYAHDTEDYTTFRARFDTATLAFRPDLAVFVGGSADYDRWQDAHWQGYVKDKCIHIIELGYVREGFAADKQQEKRSQHALLQCLLHDLDWNVHYHTITLGVTGTIYMDALACLRGLRLSSSAVDTAARAWIHMTLNHTHGLVTQRRKLDGHYISKAFTKPP
jgi:hypothetical protein